MRGIAGLGIAGHISVRFVLLPNDVQQPRERVQGAVGAEGFQLIAGKVACQYAVPGDTRIQGRVNIGLGIARAEYSELVGDIELGYNGED